MENKQIAVVLGAIGADFHSVEIKILDYEFTNVGFKVINLGAMVSQQEYIEAAVKSAADVILVSSLYGQGEMDCRGFRDKCDEAGLKGVKLYAAGNLVISESDFRETDKLFRDMGFDRVYPQDSTSEEKIADIKVDCGITE